MMENYCNIHVHLDSRIKHVASIYRSNLSCLELWTWRTANPFPKTLRPAHFEAKASRPAPPQHLHGPMLALNQSSHPGSASFFGQFGCDSYLCMVRVCPDSELSRNL
jgi:hypothetical protein